MSKGSKSRVTDKKRFDENFDKIEWDSIEVQTGRISRFTRGIEYQCQMPGFPKNPKGFEVQTEHGPGIVVESEE